jgi:hypothetical protein
MFGSFLRWPWSLPLQVYLLEGADAVMESRRQVRATLLVAHQLAAPGGENRRRFDRARSLPRAVAATEVAATTRGASLEAYRGEFWRYPALRDQCFSPQPLSGSFAG